METSSAAGSIDGNAERAVVDSASRRSGLCSYAVFHFKVGTIVKVRLRIDSEDVRHIHFTVFANGANCGTLTMERGEYTLFATMMLLGGRNTGLGTDVQVDNPKEMKA